jgi:hypothetical protein
MIDAARLLAELRGNGFRDLAGTHVSASVPVSAALLNRVIADALAAGGAPVQSIDVQPRAGDRIDVVIKVTWPFVPALTARLTIEQQPVFPASPRLTLRWSFLGAVGAFGSRFVSSLARLPDGIHLDADRLVVDIPAAAAHSPAAELLPYVNRLEVHTLDDRVLIQFELEVPASR